MVNGGVRNFMTVRSLLSNYRKQELDLQPAFQRNYVWSPAARSLLLDTVLRDFPMPLVLLRDKPKGTENFQQVVDGQQRLTTLLAFVSPSEFKEDVRFQLSATHTKAHGGSTFNQLSQELKDRILEYQVTVYTLPRSTGDDVILNIFSRLNSTGLKLNAQEIRNATYSGAFKQYVYRVATDNYSTWIDWQVLTTKELLRMGDALTVSDLTNFMLNGLQAQSSSIIERLFKEYDQNFELESIAEDRINTTLQHLTKVFSGLPKRSLLRHKTWFFALFCLAYDYIYSHARLKENKGMRALPENWAELDKKLTRMYEVQATKQRFQSVRTTNLSSRKQRHHGLGVLLFGEDWISPYGNISDKD